MHYNIRKKDNIKLLHIPGTKVRWKWSTKRVHFVSYTNDRWAAVYLVQIVKKKTMSFGDVNHSVQRSLKKIIDYGLNLIVHSLKPIKAYRKYESFWIHKLWMNRSTYKQCLHIFHICTAIISFTDDTRKRIKYSWYATKWGRILSLNHHTYFPLKLPITAYYNIHTYTNKTKNKEAKGNYKKIA